MRILSITTAFNLLQLLAFGQSVPVTMLRLPDTGQTGNYTGTFGEDSDYSIHAPFFVDNADGTVTDTVTGLMWQQTDGGEMTIGNAINYCTTLSLGGFSDWRLPNAHEAFSILNHNFSNPALDPTVFGITNAEYWWTSDYQANDNSKVWVTNAGGGIGNHPTSETISAGGTKRFHVRAVRDTHTPESLSMRFTDNGDGSITDHLTTLVWQKIPETDTISWEQALNEAENLSLAGFNDWRLPNIKELQSIHDVSLVNPSVNTAFFSTIGLKKYWSSTSLPNQTSKAWYFDAKFGITTYDLKTVKHALICVRGNINNTTASGETANLLDDCPVYPNPFDAHLYLKPGREVVNFDLFNALGDLVFSGKDIDCQYFTRLRSGVYFLVCSEAVTASHRLTTRRAVVVRR